jgi:hypothetical protein
MPFSFTYLIYASILNTVNDLRGVMAASGWSENSPTPFVTVIYTLWSQGDGVASIEASIPTLWENKHEDVKWMLEELQEENDWLHALCGLHGMM